MTRPTNERLRDIAQFAGTPYESIFERMAVELLELRAAAAEREAEIERARADGFWRGVTAKEAQILDRSAERDESAANNGGRSPWTPELLRMFAKDDRDDAASLRAALAPPADGEP